SPVHSAKNLAHIITALKTMGIIQGEQAFQFTIRGRMFDEVKYIGWLMRGLLPEIIYRVVTEGSSDIGDHADIIHGGGNLDVRPGEPAPQDEYERTDFLFLRTVDNLEEIIMAGQYYAHLLQNDRRMYDTFVSQLKEVYSKWTITRQAFREYIEMKYQGRDRQELLDRIDEIPWQDGKVSLDWIFTARWFNATPRPSGYGPRYEAPWGGVVLQVVLHEAFKYYYEEAHGKGKWAEFLAGKF
ncbi:MAG: hypothetical protein NC834_03730, partial [Candidatus Omnitrophica bacterium]|nr:hypothetical protein [Candidatus Omnitrophota bacterium]